MRYVILIPFATLIAFAVLWWIGATGCLRSERKEDDPCQHWKETLWTCQESREVCSEAFWKQVDLKREYRKLWSECRVGASVVVGEEDERHHQNHH